MVKKICLLDIKEPQVSAWVQAINQIDEPVELHWYHEVSNLKNEPKEFVGIFVENTWLDDWAKKENLTVQQAIQQMSLSFGSSKMLFWSSSSIEGFLTQFIELESQKDMVTTDDFLSLADWYAGKKASVA